MSANIQKSSKLRNGYWEAWIRISRWIDKQHFLEKSDSSDSDTRIKVIDFTVESSPVTVSLSIETLMEKIKLLVAEKYEFEYRVNSKGIVRFGIFGPSEFWCKDQNPWCVNRILFYKSEAFDWDLDARHETCSFWEICVWISRKTKNYSIFGSQHRLFGLSGLKLKTHSQILQKSSFVQVYFRLRLKRSWKFLEKSELQDQENWILIALFGIQSMWGSHKDKFHEKYFRIKILLFEHGETRIAEKQTPKNWKKVQLFTSKVKFSTDSWTFVFFFGKIESFS